MLKISTTNYTNTTQLTTNLIPFYISIVSVSISNLVIIIFTVFVVTTHEIHNKNTKTLLLLSISIFFSNFIYIFIAIQFLLNYSNWLCRLISVSYYFFNMSAFAWSLAIGVDIHYMLRCSISFKNNAVSSSKLSFNKLFVVCSASSVIVTASAFLVDLCLPDWSFSPRFGILSCWINSVNGHIIFYYVPVALVIFINIGKNNNNRRVLI